MIILQLSLGEYNLYIAIGSSEWPSAFKQGVVGLIPPARNKYAPELTLK